MNGLTARERECVELFIANNGAPNREIGKQMFLSEKTVKHYMARAMGKLGATNRTHLAIIVCRGEER